MRGEAARLSAQLEAIFADIERLKIVYRYAINQLERYAVPNLSAQSAGKWFELYLRVWDLGVQIRRGEIRHLTKQTFTYPCMHNTGTKGAVHSGLSIDDGNAIFQLMENRKLVKESRMDRWFIRMDGLDRDDVGLLDKKLSSCLAHFLGLGSPFFGRLELSGEDPHQELLVFGEAGVDTQKNQLLGKVSRTCFGPKKCSCKEDAAPWDDFSLEPVDPLTQQYHLDGVYSSAGPPQKEDVGILDIKRMWGFEEALTKEDKEADAVALARDAAELARRRQPQGQRYVVSSGVRPVVSARSLYQSKCEESGTTPKPHIRTALKVKNGTLQLNLSRIGFHSADDLQDLASIFSSPNTFHLPPVQELDVANGFFNNPAFQALCHLLRAAHFRQSVERLRLRGIAVPHRADFATLMSVLTGKTNDSFGSLLAFTQLKTLDLSFNSLNHESAVLLGPLLASLPCLEDLSLESCFPDLSVVPFSLSIEQRTVNEHLRVALLKASSRLKSLNFGSNCIPVGARWLDVLFTPESVLQRVYLQGVSSSGPSGSAVSTSDEADSWDLQQLESLKWACYSNEYSEKMLDALAAGVQNGFAQLKVLDMEIGTTCTEDDHTRADRKLADTLDLIADYGALKSCSLYLARDSIISHNLCASVERLLEVGLLECEILTLQMPQLYLTASAIHDLLSCTAAPKLRQMTIAIGFDSSGEVEENLRSCFQRSQMQSIRELTLELHTNLQVEKNDVQPRVAAIEMAHELETSWVAFDPTFAGDTQQDNNRAFGSATRTLKHSFMLSEQQKTSKRIYRYRFLATPN